MADPYAQFADAPKASDPLDFTDRYNTKLDPQKEQAFQAWSKSLGQRGSSYDYDMRGAFASGAAQAANGHFPDTFKKPNHPTFSDQSQYSGADGYKGGAWARQPNNSWTFTPSESSLKLHSPEDLQSYFQRVEPGNKLILPAREADPYAQFKDAGNVSSQPAAVGGHGPIGRRPAQWSELNPVEAVGEGALQFGTGVGAGFLGGLGYAGTAAGKALGVTQAEPKSVMASIQNALTYQPTSRSSQLMERAAKTIFKPAVTTATEVADRAATEIGKTSPTAETFLREAPSAFQAASAIVPAAVGARSAISALRTMPKTTAPTAEQVVSRLDTQQSMGAASAAPSLTNVSPELRQAIVQTAQKTGGAINPEALARHVEADTLPVRMRLSEGQALQNPRLISQEMNTRGNTRMVEHLNTQNRQLAENVRTLRDEVGPDVFSTNAAEHGDTLIAAYRARNDAAQAQISALYDRLRNAAGGSFPVDGQALLRNASTQLHRDLLFEHAPKAIMAQLNRLSRGGMTFEQFEAMRTNLATIQRSQTSSGLERRAAGVIRGAMENLPLGPAAAELKPYADAARAAARTQARAVEADPAYAAAVEGTVPPDRFVNRFVIGAPRDQVATMRSTLADDAAATQTMGVALLDHLREQARLSPHYEGNFAAASFNKALTRLSPKMQSLVSPAVAEQLEKVGNVARYVTSQPRGSYVNNSNTFVAGAATHAADVVENVANKAAFGLPVGTLTRNALAAGRQRNAFRRSTAPGAGLGQLEERH